MAILKNGQLLDKQEYENENELQEKVFSTPQLIKGNDDIEVYSIKREVILPRAGILDILQMDAIGNIIAVEVKLNRNPQSRREVIAQIFDYLSDLSSLTFFELDNIVKGELTKVINTMEKGEELPRNINSFLKAGIIKLIIVVDQINEDLKRIISFIGERTDLDVKLIEISKYDNGELLIPNIIIENNKIGLISNNIIEDIGKSNFSELINYYSNINNNIYNISRGSNKYKIIDILTWPPQLHYEFLLHDKENVGIEFHIELNKYRELNNIIKEYSLQKINEYEINYIPNWDKNNGRLRILVPFKDGSEKISKCMHDFINLTKNRIEKNIFSIKEKSGA